MYDWPAGPDEDGSVVHDVAAVACCCYCCCCCYSCWVAVGCSGAALAEGSPRNVEAQVRYKVAHWTLQTSARKVPLQFSNQGFTDLVHWFVLGRMPAGCIGCWGSFRTCYALAETPDEPSWVRLAVPGWDIR